MHLSTDAVEFLVVGAVAHAVTEGTPEATFHRAHKSLQDLLPRVGQEDLYGLCTAIRAEFFFLRRERRAVLERVQALEATMRGVSP